MTIKEFLLGASQTLRGDQLADEITNGTSVAIDVDDIFETHNNGDIRRLFINNVPDGQESSVQAVVDVHVADPLYLDSDKEAAKRQDVATNVKQLFSGLLQVDPKDAAYIAYARAVAIENGETNQFALGIDTRTKAVNYVTSLSEWTSLPASARTWLALDKQASMRMWQALFNFIR